MFKTGSIPNHIIKLETINSDEYILEAVNNGVKTESQEVPYSDFYAHLMPEFSSGI